MSRLNPASFRVVVRQSLANDTAQRIYRALYVDKRMVAINKAPGMDAQVGISQLLQDSVHPAGLGDGVETPSSNTLLPVHRLDKATTGCFIFARTPDMARELSRQFQQRSINKTYYAIVRAGRKSFEASKGVIDRPIEVSAEGFAKLSSSEGKHTDRVSQTEWELVGCSPILPLSLLKLRMLTGHKHQLRIHLSKFLHAPILGDGRHSVSRPKGSITNFLRTLEIPESRLFLHCSSLGIMRYTKSRKRLTVGIQAPFPEDFNRLLHHTRIPFDPELVRAKLFLDGQPLPIDTCQELDGRLFP